MKATVVVVLLLLIGVGFPAMAWYAGRRLRLAEPPVLAEASYSFRRRHGLSEAEMQVVEIAIRRGTRVDEPRLRPLAAERAQALLAEAVRQQAEVQRFSRRYAPWALVALILLAVLLRPRPAQFLNPALLAGLTPLLFERWQLRRIRQAAASNDD